MYSVTCPISREIRQKYDAQRQVMRVNGFTLLELVVVVAIISVLLAVAADRLWGLQVAAERTAMESALGSLRSALGIKVAEYIARDNASGMRELVGGNPMDQLAEQPKNYLGALARPEPAAIEGGMWYFDTAARVLVYRVRNSEYFVSSAGAQMRFAVRPAYEDRNRNGVFDKGDAIQGIRLEALEAYRWTN